MLVVHFLQRVPLIGMLAAHCYLDVARSNLLQFETATFSALELATACLEMPTPFVTALK